LSCWELGLFLIFLEKEKLNIQKILNYWKPY